MTQKDNELPTGPPAPKPLSMPDNPWPGLLKQTGLKKDPLKFEQQAAVDLATATANTISNMRLMAWNADAVINWTAYAPPSLPSGEALAKKFAGQGEEMRRIVQAHLDILQDMMDTFIAAGKNYDAGEQENEELFDKISTTTKLPVFPGESKVPKFDWGKDGNFKDGHTIIGDVPDSLTKDGTKFLDSDIWVESKNQSWHTLYSLGEHIKTTRVAELVADDAGEWQFMGKKVQEYFGELLNRVDSVTADQWTGSGGPAAYAAVKGYVRAIKPLQQSLFRLHDIMEYTARWLGAMAEATPPESTNPADKDPKADDWLPYYQGQFGDIYVKGAEQSATHVPELVYPNASFKGVPALPKIPTPDATGKRKDGSGDTKTAPGPGPGLGVGGPGGGPGYSPTAAPGPGAGDAETRQQALDAAKRQDAAQRQADAAARKQQQESLEFQRQQQAEAKKQQAQQAADQAAQQSQQQMQQAMAAGQQAIQQAAQAAQQAAQQDAQKQLADKQLAGLPGVPSIPGMDIDPKTGLPKLGGGGPGPGLASSPLSKDMVQASKLFPRAGTAVTTAGTLAGAAGRAGMAPMAGTPGTPGAPHAPGRGAGGEGGKDQKRPTWLQSADHLDEALGDAPRAVKPVVEQ
ncbi:hypothetical protein [Nocardia sp. 2TAF39]|uniref:hypothetical protein n=1 Tax=Nocardia sp. 2TAF39 TaxID=3233017 RepID=UPI003F973BE0